MSDFERFNHLKIDLEAIKLATNDFHLSNRIGIGGFGEVYKGDLSWKGHTTTVALKCLKRFGQGEREFWNEILMCSLYRHENIVPLLGFCKESENSILVYEYQFNRSLDLNLDRNDLTWVGRLKICIGAAKGIAYLHSDRGTQQRLLHRDIKSANILLNEYWNAKIGDFGLSKFCPANADNSIMFSNAVGTVRYIDPVYGRMKLLTKESDVYSFGIVLFEVLCGRLCTMRDHRPLDELIKEYSHRPSDLNEIIFSKIRDEIDPRSLNVFAAIAFQCLKKERKERPLMNYIVTELEAALLCQTVFKEVQQWRYVPQQRQCPQPQQEQQPHAWPQQEPHPYAEPHQEQQQLRTYTTTRRGAQQKQDPQLTPELEPQQVPQQRGVRQQSRGPQQKEQHPQPQHEQQPHAWPQQEPHPPHQEQQQLRAYATTRRGAQQRQDPQLTPKLEPQQVLSQRGVQQQSRGPQQNQQHPQQVQQWRYVPQPLPQHEQQPHAWPQQEPHPPHQEQQQLRAYATTRRGAQQRQDPQLTPELKPQQVLSQRGVRQQSRGPQQNQQHPQQVQQWRYVPQPLPQHEQQPHAWPQQEPHPYAELHQEQQQLRTYTTTRRGAQQRQDPQLTPKLEPQQVLSQRGVQQQSRGPQQEPHKQLQSERGLQQRRGPPQGQQSQPRQGTGRR